MKSRVEKEDKEEKLDPQRKEGKMNENEEDDNDVGTKEQKIEISKVIETTKEYGKEFKSSKETNEIKCLCCENKIKRPLSWNKSNEYSNSLISLECLCAECRKHT